MALGREQIVPALARRTQDIPSAAFGGEIRIRELTRAEWRASNDHASTGKEDADGAPIIYIDHWAAARFAAGVIDPATDAPMFTADEVLAWPNRADLWREIGRIADAIDRLSEADRGALKSGDTSPDQE